MYYNLDKNKSEFKWTDKTYIDKDLYNNIEAENARLKAEVERLTEDNRQLTKVFEIAEGIIKRMGNAAENAAKEGKQS